MKMNVPQNEASNYVQKIKERKMGYLFENMEKMDIQAERRKTKEAREQLAKEQEQLTASALSKIKSIIQICQDFHATHEYTISKLTADCSLSSEDALEAIQKFWK